MLQSHEPEDLPGPKAELSPPATDEPLEGQSDQVLGEGALPNGRLVTEHKNLDSYVLCGKPFESEPLSERKYSLSERYRIYNEGLSDELDEATHEAPFSIVIKTLYTIARINPIAFNRFLKDEVLFDAELQKKANREAYHYAVERPMELYSQGKFDEALKSFGEALSRAPNRRSEILETLAVFCVMVDFQKQKLAENPGFLDSLSSKMDAWKLFGSGLCSSVVFYKQDTRDRMIPVFSDSLIWSPFVEPPPLNLDAVRTGMHDTKIPFRLIAAEALIEAAGLHPDQRLVEMGINVDSENNISQYYEGIALWLTDDTIEAVDRLNSYKEKLCGYNRSYFSSLVFSLALKEADRESEALDEAGNFLGDSSCGEIFIDEFLAICELSAEKNPSPQTKWDVALPYLKRTIEDSRGVEHFWDYPTMLALGEAYENCGMKKEAMDLYQRLSDLENKERELNTMYQQREDWRTKNLSNCDQVRAELDRRAERLQQKLSNDTTES